MANDPELHVLEHLGYVIECLAQGVNGEAKSELGSLVRALTADERYAISDASVKAGELDKALALLRANNGQRAASILARFSRGLWKRVLSD